MCFVDVMTTMFITHRTFLSMVLLPQLCTKTIVQSCSTFYCHHCKFVRWLHQDYEIEPTMQYEWGAKFVENHPTLYKDNYQNMVSMELSILRTIDNSMVHHHTFYKANCNFQFNWFKKVQQPLHFEEFEIGQFCLFW